MAVAVVLGIVAMGFLSLAAAPARAASVPISLYGSATAGWGTSSASESIPGPTLTVSQGDSVTITLKSTDGATHEFFIDYNNNGALDAGEPVSSTFTNTTTLTFTANQAGSFTYYCLIHPSAMKGTFIVQGTGSNSAPSATGNTLVFVGVALVVVVVVGVAAIAMRRRKPKA